MNQYSAPGTYVSPQELIDDFCVKTGYTFTELKSRSRLRHIVKHRMALIYFIRDKTNLTLVQIADRFGLDHSTVSHALQTVKTDMSLYDDYKKWIELVTPLQNLETIKTFRK